MKRYDSYKDSGVKWIGEIPSNWEKSRIRMVGDLYGGLTKKKGSDFNDDDNPSNKPFVPFTNIFNNTYISKDHFQYVNVEENENQNRVLKNDLFFLMSSESYEDLGKCSILLDDVEELYLNSFCKGFRIKDSKVYPLFLNYQLLGSLHKEMISVEGNGFTRINLRQDRLLDIPVFIPPLSEQQQIVSFLDIKTSLIDSLIEKTQRKIELLKEQRTSLINEVVTKGLNTNVEMKDSGFEWIGKIPSHWEFVKIGHLNRVVRGGSPRPSGDPRFFNGDFIHWITVKDITSKTGKYVTTTDTKLTEEGMKQSRVLEPETLVLTNSGVTLGIPGILKIRGCINDGSVGFLDMSPKIERDYLYYFWTTQTELLLEQQSGYGQPNLNIEIVSNVRFPLPPLSEQQQIVEYLDEQTQKIDKTISIEEKRIQLLKEYKQSLISEVVTGKKRVV